MSTIHSSLVRPIVCLISDESSVGHNLAMIDHEEHDGQLEIRGGRLYYYKEVANHTNEQLEDLLSKLGEKAWGKDKLTPDESTTNGRLYIKASQLGDKISGMKAEDISGNIENIVAEFKELPFPFPIIATKRVNAKIMLPIFALKEMKTLNDNLLYFIFGV